MNMKFQWFRRWEAVGANVELMLHHGDMYIMSEKAVGTDWMSSSMFTVRHAAGSEKVVKLKVKKRAGDALDEKEAQKRKL
jgi:hypothetical protein